jgi:hypothetical protein
MTRNTVTRRFDSFDAFLSQALVVPPKQDSGSSRQNRKDSWAGTKTFAEAVSLATRGWPEGAAQALALRASIDSAVRQIVTARKDTFAWDVVGDAVDVGKYLTGEPECWINKQEDGESQSGKVVKICANLAASGSVSTKSLFARGAVVLATIDILESLGHRVELWIAHGSSGSVGVFQQFTLIKSASQPLDADRVAFCLCHAACLRRLSFSIMEQNGHLPNATYPHRVEFDKDAIVTSEALRGSDFTPSELLSEVSRLCEACGIAIPADEIAELIAAE